MKVLFGDSRFARRAGPHPERPRRARGRIEHQRARLGVRTRQLAEEASVVADTRRIHPQRQRAPREAEISQVQIVIDAIQTDAVVDAASRKRRAIHQRAHVVVARRVGRRRPGTLVEPPVGHRRRPRRHRHVPRRPARPRRRRRERPRPARRPYRSGVVSVATPAVKSPALVQRVAAAEAADRPAAQRARRRDRHVDWSTH